MDQKYLLYIVIAIVIVCVVLKYHKDEGYIKIPLSSQALLKRTPVTFAYQGDGMTLNPHYIADPSDRLVPLEYGGQDFYKRYVNVKNRPTHQYGGCRKGNCAPGLDSELMNDSKTRLDMIESGDMDMHRLLNNIDMSGGYGIVGGRPYDVDAMRVDPNEHPLYADKYHYDTLLGN